METKTSIMLILTTSCIVAGDEECSSCHHLSLPQDKSTPCSYCHSDMHNSASIFNHGFHESELGGNRSCRECHNLSFPKSMENSKPCLECHEKDMVNVTNAQAPLKHMALSYQKAMHKQCLQCHDNTCSDCHKGVEHGKLES